VNDESEKLGLWEITNASSSHIGKEPNTPKPSCSVQIEMASGSGQFFILGNFLIRNVNEII
jgi:hypothetical protein